MGTIFTNYYEVFAILLFAIGFSILLLNRNLIKKMIGLNIMDIAVFLNFVAKGYVKGRTAPMIEVVNGAIDASKYINPVPTGLMLTGIVVSVSMTAFGLAIVLKLYKKYGSLDIDEILLKREREDL